MRDRRDPQKFGEALAAARRVFPHIPLTDLADSPEMLNVPDFDDLLLGPLARYGDPRDVQDVYQMVKIQ